MDWDDWKVFGEIAAGNSGEHGECIKERKHYRCIRSTNEVPTEEEIQEMDRHKQALGELVAFVGNASKSWYSLGGQQDLLIVPDGCYEPIDGAPLSQYSNVVKNLTPSRQQGIFVKLEDRQKAEEILSRIQQ